MALYYREVLTMSKRNRFIDSGYKKYEELNREEAQSKYNEIIKEWEAFLDENDSQLKLGTDYFVHQRNLTEVVRRCDKRVLYFYIFHDLEECEYKEIALLCFWINTLKPFMVVKESSPIYNAPNEMFSLFLILSTIRKIYSEVFKNKAFNYPSPERIKDILYDFKYCSISRESMISFVETLADTYGVGINYILNKLNGKKST